MKNLIFVLQKSALPTELHRRHLVPAKPVPVSLTREGRSRTSA